MTDNTQRNIKITVACILVLLGVSLGLVFRKFMMPPQLNQQQMQQQGAYLLEKPRIFREIDLVDQDGKPFTKDRLKGKWSLLFFGFTFCPDICPTTMGMLNKMYNGLQKSGRGKDVQIIMVTVDPARDTPEKLDDYVHYFNENFIGVTGDFMAITRLAADLNIAFMKVPGGGENYLVDHSGNIVLINPYGDYHGFFKPPHDPVRLQMTFNSARAQFE